MSEVAIVESGSMGRVAYARIAPNEDLVQGVEKLCLSEGFRHAFVRGALGSLVDACLGTLDGKYRQVKGPAVEIVSLAGEVRSMGDGSLCASGGKDGTTMLWDLNESKHLYSLTAGDEIHALVFSPNRYWLCAATASAIIIFDLEKKSRVDSLTVDFMDVGKKSRDPECVSLAWSADGQTLFAGYTDNKIRAWGVMTR